MKHKKRQTNSKFTIIMMMMTYWLLKCNISCLFGYVWKKQTRNLFTCTIVSNWAFNISAYLCMYCYNNSTYAYENKIEYENICVCTLWTKTLLCMCMKIYFKILLCIAIDILDQYYYADHLPEHKMILYKTMHLVIDVNN